MLTPFRRTLKSPSHKTLIMRQNAGQTGAILHHFNRSGLAPQEAWKEFSFVGNGLRVWVA